MANSILPILIGYFAIGKQLKSKHSIRIKRINRHSYPPIRDIQIQINYEARATLRIQIAVCQTSLRHKPSKRFRKHQSPR